MKEKKKKKSIFEGKLPKDQIEIVEEVVKHSDRILSKKSLFDPKKSKPMIDNKKSDE